MSFKNFNNGRLRVIMRRSRLEELLALIIGREKLIKPDRGEPRAVKERPKPFSLLSSPRHEFQEIPNRLRYWKTT